MKNIQFLSFTIFFQNISFDRFHGVENNLLNATIKNIINIAN